MDKKPYVIVHTQRSHTSDDMGLLVERVNELIAEGYEPCGGVVARVGTQGGAYLMQAMVKVPTYQCEVVSS